MPFLTLRRFRLVKKTPERKRSGYTPEDQEEIPTDSPDPLAFSVLNLVGKPPKRTNSVYNRSGSEKSGPPAEEKIEQFAGDNFHNVQF